MINEVAYAEARAASYREAASQARAIAQAGLEWCEAKACQYDLQAAVWDARARKAFAFKKISVIVTPRTIALSYLIVALIGFITGVACR
jgi:hypothetical protein